MHVTIYKIRYHSSHVAIVRFCIHTHTKVYNKKQNKSNYLKDPPVIWLGLVCLVLVKFGFESFGTWVISRWFYMQNFEHLAWKTTELWTILGFWFGFLCLGLFWFGVVWSMDIV